MNMRSYRRTMTARNVRLGVRRAQPNYEEALRKVARRGYRGINIQQRMATRRFLAPGAVRIMENVVRTLAARAQGRLSARRRNTLQLRRALTRNPLPPGLYGKIKKNF